VIIKETTMNEMKSMIMRMNVTADELIAANSEAQDEFELAYAATLEKVSRLNLHLYDVSLSHDLIVCRYRDLLSEVGKDQIIGLKSTYQDTKQLTAEMKEYAEAITKLNNLQHK